MTKIEVDYYTQRGSTRRVRAEGRLAHVLQHELDHLDGILYTDKLFVPEEEE